MYSTASMRPAAAIILRWRGVQQLGLVVTTPFMSSHDLTKSPNACLLHGFLSERSELTGAAPHSAIGGPARIGGMPGSRNRTDCRPERKVAKLGSGIVHARQEKWGCSVASGFSHRYSVKDNASIVGEVFGGAAIMLRWRGVQRLGSAVTTLFISSHDLARHPNACLFHVFPSERRSGCPTPGVGGWVLGFSFPCFIPGRYRYPQAPAPPMRRIANCSMANPSDDSPVQAPRDCGACIRASLVSSGLCIH